MEQSINLSEYLVIIPARSGSKAIKNKNLLKFEGETLLERTYRQALRCFNPENIIVSTDSAEYLNLINKRFKTKYKKLRDISVSLDDSSAMDVIKWELSSAQNLERFRGVVYLQVTSPLRKDRDIYGAIKLFHSSECDVVASVTKANENPFFVHRRVDPKGFIRPLFQDVYTSRQAAPIVYKLNGAIFVISPDAIGKNELSNFPKTIPYMMDPKDSLDIDTAEDFNSLKSV